MITCRTIQIKNIYYMLTYAFEVLKQKNYEEIAKEEFDNVQNLFAAILSKGIAQQLKQGLYREYVSLTEDLPLMRGKLNINGTIKNKIARRQILNCEHDELSENNLLNKIIKKAATVLIRYANVDVTYKAELKKEMLFFNGIDDIDLLAINWNTLKFQRCNQSYKMLINVCYFVLDGLLYSDKKGHYKVASFLDEQKMHHLYEKFILKYYQYHYDKVLSVGARQIDWALEEGVVEFLPTMQTDIALTDKNKALIIDAKFYSHTMQTKAQYDKLTFHSHNMYQIFTYVKNLDPYCSGNVSGMLLYAKTDETVTPNNSFRISGNEISVKTLDLNREFNEIAKQLDGIVRKYFNISVPNHMY